MKSTELPISCPGDIGCECMVNDDCSNKNCTNVVRSERYCFPKIGDPFPRLITLDQLKISISSLKARFDIPY